MLKQLVVTAVFLGATGVTVASVLKTAAKSADRVARHLHASALAGPLRRGETRPVPRALVIENAPGESREPSSSKAEEITVMRRKPGRIPDETDEEFRARRRERRSRKQPQAQFETDQNE